MSLQYIFVVVANPVVAQCTSQGNSISVSPATDSGVSSGASSPNDYQAVSRVMVDEQKPAAIAAIGEQGTRQKRTRTVYTSEQLNKLKEEFQINRYPSISKRNEIAQAIQLSDRTIKVWFQNMRMKIKKEQDTLGINNHPPRSPDAEQASLDSSPEEPEEEQKEEQKPKKYYHKQLQFLFQSVPDQYKELPSFDFSINEIKPCDISLSDLSEDLEYMDNKYRERIEEDDFQLDEFVTFHH